jgi:hypothetical protein
MVSVYGKGMEEKLAGFSGGRNGNHTAILGRCAG